MACLMTGSGKIISSSTTVGRDQRVAGPGIRKPDGGHELAGVHLVALLAAVGVQLQEAPDALALALGGVHHVGAGPQGTGVHPHVRQLADVRVGLHLEGEGRQRPVLIGLTRDLLPIEGLALDRGHVERARQVVHHAVEQRLDALVLEGGTDEHGGHLDVERGLADGGPDLLGLDLLALQVHDHELLVLVGDRLQQLLPILFGELYHVLGDVRDLPRRPEVVGVDDGPHLYEVHDALELALGAYGQLHRDGVRPEPVQHGPDGLVEVGPYPVHLVDESYPGYPVLVSLTPHRLRLRLYPRHRVEQSDGAVEHAQRTLHLYGEVHVSGRVYNIDAVLVGDTAMDALAGALAVLGGAFDAAPENGGRGRGYGDTALPLLGHPVHHGVAVVDLAQLMGKARIEQDALRRRRFAGIDVGHDADISNPL
jgi:hypothetical protein